MPRQQETTKRRAPPSAQTPLPRAWAWSWETAGRERSRAAAGRRSSSPQRAGVCAAAGISTALAAPRSAARPGQQRQEGLTGVAETCSGTARCQRAKRNARTSTSHGPKQWKPARQRQREAAPTAACWPAGGFSLPPGQLGAACWAARRPKTELLLGAEPQRGRASVAAATASGS